MNNDIPVLLAQVAALRSALTAVLDARDVEAKTTMSWQNARENFSDSHYERKEHERAMLAASEAERAARLLLATLKEVPQAEAARKSDEALMRQALEALTNYEDRNYPDELIAALRTRLGESHEPR